MTEKSNKTQSEKMVSYIWAIVIIVASISFFHSCRKANQEKEIELKGIGMLEARGISTEILPSHAGSDYYSMMSGLGDTFTQEEKQDFLRKIVCYQNAFGLLRQKGVSASEIYKIPDYKLAEAMRQRDSGEAIDALAKQYR